MRAFINNLSTHDTQEIITKNNKKPTKTRDHNSIDI